MQVVSIPSTTSYFNLYLLSGYASTKSLILTNNTSNRLISQLPCMSKFVIPSSTSRLPAVKLIVDRNLELLDIVYEKQEGDEDDFKDEVKPDVAPTQARFSTKVISIKGD